MPTTRDKSKPRQRITRKRPERVSAKPSKKLPAPRRTRTGDSETRDRLLNAAEQLMREEGYAAITTRRLGAKAGLHPQLVHYYFSGMDNLFLELWRRLANQYLARQAQAFLSLNPLRTIWEHDLDPRNASLAAELMALARHRKALGEEMANYIEKIRVMQASALKPAMDAYGLRDIFGSAEVLALFMVGLARILVVEGEIGVKSGHAGARVLIAGWLDDLEARRRHNLGDQRDEADRNHTGASLSSREEASEAE
jgi:AcrR family transcriptional regulator